ncbi:MAG: gamma-glutamyl-gamma-aminobutyrate hydrolase family protein [Hyphomonadaceae bacterium]|nr:gamma-glutamyl-gamma-aminobutyrate hydrolase family protein [Hyphomonadaceae bacterium]
MNPPLIGLVLDESPGQPDGSGFSQRPYYALRKDYFAAIERAGAVPIGVSYSWRSFEALLDVCDGWIVPGADYRFESAWYVNPPPGAVMIATERRDFERRAVAKLIADDRPLFGICNGMQLIAGVNGGRMTYREPAPGDAVVHYGANAAHPIEVAPNTRLARILAPGAYSVNSTHKEHVVEPGRDVAITARSPDGGVEALEMPGKFFVLGVQWHPELDAAGQALFEAFVAAVRARNA